MKFSLMFFASSEEALAGDKYRLVLNSAQFADSNGFEGVWVPERHFTEFGSLYPNPAVLHAALAASTRRIKLLAGSVVAPIHNPIRIAEEWSMVDNLSNGRVGISFASGWNPDDFVFSPEKYANRHDEMLASIRTVQHLWRGGAIDAQSGNGKPTQVRIYPTPVQRELPFWLTAAGNPQTFIRAGEIGANLLTHILDQDPDQLAKKIGLYREARAKQGWDPSTGIVSVMLHTFVGSDAAWVREQARAPFCNYIRRNIGLLNGLAQSRGQQVDVRSMPAQELDEFVQFLYERFAQSRGLIGTPQSCLPLIKSLEAIGVDDVACLLDFGPPVDLILESLPHLLRLRELHHVKAPAPKIRFDAACIQARCEERMSGTAFNEGMRQYGIQIDGDFGAIQEIWRRSGEALGKVWLPAPTSSKPAYTVHPAFLDACSRVLAAAIDQNPSETQSFYLPSGAGAFRIHMPPTEQEAWSHATLRQSSLANTLEGDIRIYDSAGRLLIEIEALRLQKVDSDREAQHDLTPFLYRRDWKRIDLEPSAKSPASGERAPGHWLIFADRQGVGERLARELKESGNTCSLIFSDASAHDYSALEKPLKGVLHLWSLDLAPSAIARRKDVSASVLKIVKALAQSKGSQARLWLMTAGAMPVSEGEAIAAAQAPLWGLGRAIAIEHPTLWGGLIDLDPENLDDSALGEIILTSSREDMIALRGGQQYAARMVREDRELPQAQPIRFKKDATYLITGGWGGIGLRLASWLLDRGAGEVALLGRSEPSPAVAKILHRLKARVLLGDLSRREDVAKALDEIKRSMPPLQGVFHLAGSLDDALLIDQDAERFHRAGIGKAEGAWHLHELTSDLPLDHFVLFSSMASLVTTSGQGNYASANGFVDALAHLRRAEGKPALTINWGPWSDIGHAATDYGRRAHERLSLLGVNSLTPEISLASLERLMTSGLTQAGVISVDWNRLLQADPAAAGSPLLRELLKATTPPAQRETEWVIALRACAPADRLDFVRSSIAQTLASVLRLANPQSISPTQSVFDMGLDSILALELTNRLASGFGTSLRATLLFTHSTLDALASFVLSKVLPAQSEVMALEASSELTEAELSRLIALEISSR